MPVLGLLYDVHGNLPALEAIIADAEAAGVDRWLLGGDYAAFGPWPRETLERLRTLDDAVWIRGNGERWLLDPPPDVPEVERALALAREELATELDWLHALPETVELDGVLYCHGSPLSDVETFGIEPGADDERLLAGAPNRTVVFGHSHLQFRRAGPAGTELLNPGSGGMPRDGDRRAAWALRRADGEVELRRTEYDVAPAAGAVRRKLGDFGELVARRIERGSD